VIPVVGFASVRSKCCIVHRPRLEPSMWTVDVEEDNTRPEASAVRGRNSVARSWSAVCGLVSMGASGNGSGGGTRRLAPTRENVSKEPIGEGERRLLLMEVGRSSGTGARMFGSTNIAELLERTLLRVLLSWVWRPLEAMLETGYDLTLALRRRLLMFEGNAGHMALAVDAVGVDHFESAKAFVSVCPGNLAEVFAQGFSAAFRPRVSGSPAVVDGANAHDGYY
jgi:hypothetical protein